MSDILDNIIKDIQKHCKNVDDFNKDVLSKIDHTNKELVDFLWNVFNNKQKDKLLWNPFNDNEKDKKKKQSSKGGIFNPFDE